MKDNPLISIYMPTEPPTTGDSGDKIGPAPDYSNWEMIIVDDCSTSPGTTATVRHCPQRSAYYLHSQRH